MHPQPEVALYSNHPQSEDALYSNHPSHTDQLRLPSFTRGRSATNALRVSKKLPNPKYDHPQIISIAGNFRMVEISV